MLTTQDKFACAAVILGATAVIVVPVVYVFWLFSLVFNAVPV